LQYIGSAAAKKGEESALAAGRFAASGENEHGGY